MLHKLFSKDVTLDSILSSFTKTMEELKDYAETHSNHAKDKTEEAERLHEEIVKHEDERTSALNIHSNLTTLLSKGN